MDNSLFVACAVGVTKDVVNFSRGDELSCTQPFKHNQDGLSRSAATPRKVPFLSESPRRVIFPRVAPRSLKRHAKNSIRIRGIQEGACPYLASLLRSALRRPSARRCRANGEHALVRQASGPDFSVEESVVLAAEPPFGRNNGAVQQSGGRRADHSAVKAR